MPAEVKSHGRRLALKIFLTVGQPCCRTTGCRGKILSPPPSSPPYQDGAAGLGSSLPLPWPASISGATRAKGKIQWSFPHRFRVVTAAHSSPLALVRGAGEDIPILVENSAPVAAAGLRIAGKAARESVVTKSVKVDTGCPRTSSQR